MTSIATESGVKVSLEALIKLRVLARQLNLQQYQRMANQQQGNYQSRLRGRGLDFSEVRHYQAGDDIRHMDWHVTARLGQPHVKVYHEERERPTQLIINAGRSMQFGSKKQFKYVLAAKLAALLAWAAADSGDRVGGLVYNGEQRQAFKPILGNRGVLPLLKSLAKIDLDNSQSASSDLLQALSHLTKQKLSGHKLILITDFNYFDADCAKQLSQLRAKNTIVAFRTHDQLEATPPAPNCYKISDGEVQTSFDTRNRVVYKNYQSQLDSHMDYIETYFKQRAIPFLQYATDMSLKDKLAELAIKGLHK